MEKVVLWASPLVVLVWESPAFSHTAVRNSLTCFRESELWRVSRG